MNFLVTPALLQTSLVFFGVCTVSKGSAAGNFLHSCFCDYIGAMLTSAPSNLQIPHGGFGLDDL